MIAACTELSRRAAETAIANGEVTVNGVVVTKLGTTINPSTDQIYYKGKKLELAKDLVYIAFNKPRGVIVSKSDEFGRKTIWDEIPEWKDKLNSVGRLDSDSEGLIILTNDGALINALTHPKHEIWKTYRCWVRGNPTPEQIKQLSDGVTLDDGPTLPARLKVMKSEEDNTLLEVSIREGRNRQIRRMFDVIECPVRSLKRIAIGAVNIGKLKAGEWRWLRITEVGALSHEPQYITRSGAPRKFGNKPFNRPNTFKPRTFKPRTQSK